jgi:predicted HAD superfamily Cof-like phosphohydrolase
MIKLRNFNREDKVEAFRLAAGKTNVGDQPGEIDLVIDCIDEEFEEFIEAAKAWFVFRTPETREQLVKEWADLAYVVSQAAVYFKINGDAAFNRVHESNMTKVVDGKVIFREDGKILKPEGYQSPNMAGL